MPSGFIDNRTELVKDDLVRTIKSGDKVSIASSLFSMYAYRELKDQLEQLDEFRFIFTSKTFTKDTQKKEQREFYIPQLNREQGLYGTELEIKLRNELTQKAIASECADWIRRSHARFMSPQDEQFNLPSFLSIEHANTGDGLTPNQSVITNAVNRDENDSVAPEQTVGYMPFAEFSTVQLGTSRHTASNPIVARLDISQTEGFLNSFNQAWDSGQLHDVTDTVISNIEQMYQENAPELIYYMALYRIFNDFLLDTSEDVLVKEGTGFKNSKIWNMLYDFQQDAAIAIINKLNSFHGCILADSVGLGKTFTALAVIKYFESCNRNVLVLCPKKLSDNWMTYKSNVLNNPIADDRLRYDVLFHTDLSREYGRSATGIRLDQINWGNYDLVVIDESHNFRNGSDSAAKAGGKENRYNKLLNKVIRSGVPTKVLMLSATPVNNRFRDLQSQLALAYEGNNDNWREKFGLHADIDSVFHKAQKVYSAWMKLDVEERTTKRLMDMLDYDFFTILDQVTVARSRKHIQKYYDMNAIGAFPKRNAPINKRPPLSTDPNSVDYNKIYAEIEKLKLALYTPSEFILDSRKPKYFDEEEIQGLELTTTGRENGIRKLMATNLLKRFESSVNSFRMTLSRISEAMTATVSKINEYEQSIAHGQAADETVSQQLGEALDLDQDDVEMTDDLDFTTSGKRQFAIADMDWKSWRDLIQADIKIIDNLLKMITDIDPAHDAKLQELFSIIKDKQVNPINAGNKKILIFTAFADTADYLYDNVRQYAQNLGLQAAEITGTRAGQCAIKRVGGDMTNILTCFSPVSKERNVVAPHLEDCNIDILIATDCISEGQNLQDCDMMVDYDIHWNPVRIIQRFGRIDRIGSKNDRIQLVNFWPNIKLDSYLKLKERVEARMRIAVMTSTGDDDLINKDENGDLEYRAKQLQQMQDEVPDLEDVDGGISITDLGLNEFRMDLVEYHKNNPNIEHTPTGINAVVRGEEPGILFVLRNINKELNQKKSKADKNRIYPFYLVYVKSNGEILHTYLEPKACLDLMRSLCKGKTAPDNDLCKIYNRETNNGKDMRKASNLLDMAISSIIEQDAQSAQNSFFSSGTTSFLDAGVQGLDDFELICFLVVKPEDGE